MNCCEYCKADLLGESVFCSIKCRINHDEESLGDYYASQERNSRFRLFKRDGYICFWCGSYLFNISTGGICLDHIYPRSLGGPDTASNLVTSCKGCNGHKHTKVDLELIEKCLNYVKARNETFYIDPDLKIKFLNRK